MCEYVVYVEDALERRVRLSAILKYGRQAVAFRHLLIDAYVGIGVAYRYRSYSELGNTAPPQPQTMEWGCASLRNMAKRLKGNLHWGCDWVIGFPFGILEANERQPQEAKTIS